MYFYSMQSYPKFKLIKIAENFVRREKKCLLLEDDISNQALIYIFFTVICIQLNTIHTFPSTNSLHYVTFVHFFKLWLKIICFAYLLK